MGRDAAGVIGIRLARSGDQVVGMGVVAAGSDILVLTETGYGKRVAARRVPAQAPRQPGRRAHLARRQPRPATSRPSSSSTEQDEELLLISSGGQVVRTDVQSVNRYGSQARGVIVMRLNEGDEVAGIAVFRAEDWHEQRGDRQMSRPDRGRGAVGTEPRGRQRPWRGAS